MTRMCLKAERTRAERQGVKATCYQCCPHMLKGRNSRLFNNKTSSCVYVISFLNHLRDSYVMALYSS